jgi:hypothetical protein
MVLTKSGNLGINSTSPTEKLDVVGNVAVTGSITGNTIVKNNGTSSQFLKADGSVDSNSYLTTTGSGINLTGIVTSINAGDFISVSSNTGIVTVSVANTSNGYGARYISTDNPSGGNDGDIWYKVIS